MKRGEPPRRLTPLKRSTKPIKRSRVARKSDKKRTEDSDEAACRNAVIDRAHGMCEAPWAVTIDMFGTVIVVDHTVSHWDAGDRMFKPHVGHHMHHKWPEDRRARRHEPDRCVLLCSAAHAWVHANPSQAQRVGLLRAEPLS